MGLGRDYKAVWQEHYDDAKAHNMSNTEAEKYADVKLVDQFADQADYLYDKYREGAFD